MACSMDWGTDFFSSSRVSTGGFLDDDGAKNFDNGSSSKLDEWDPPWPGLRFDGADTGKDSGPLTWLINGTPHCQALSG